MYKLSRPISSISLPQALQKYISILIAFAAILLTSCSSDNAQTSSLETKILSLSTSKLPANLATIFKETCSQCHTKNSTGAPIAGDVQAWEKILSKGMNSTLERAVNGYGGMPPGGQCFECTSEQLIKLIEFMSGKLEKEEA